MAIAITDEVLVAYSQCPRKAYLLVYSEERGQLHEYQQILEQKRLANKCKYFDILRQNKPDVYSYNVENIRNGYELLIDARLAANQLQADCDLLTRVSKHTYEPTVFIGTHSINDTDKLRLMFVGYVLEKVQGDPPITGNIITMDGKPSPIKLQQSQKTLTSLLDPLQKWIPNDSSPAEPPAILNKHCPVCQFRTHCETKAEQEDNLSRLNGVTPRVIRRYEKKGIFTVKQLSYLFRVFSQSSG